MRIFSPAERGTAAAPGKPGTAERPETVKHALLWVAAVRTIAALVALPLLPVLYRHDFLVLVALRPSLGILLLGAILARQGGMSLWAMLLIAVPLQLLIVWLYFLLGRAWESEIHSDDTLPFFTARLLRRDQVRRLREALHEHGTRLVVLARGSVREIGTHEELLARGGLYAQLWRRQSGGFLSDAPAEVA